MAKLISKTSREVQISGNGVKIKITPNMGSENKYVFTFPISGIGKVEFARTFHSGLFNGDISKMSEKEVLQKAEMGIDFIERWSQEAKSSWKAAKAAISEGGWIWTHDGLAKNLEEAKDLLLNNPINFGGAKTIKKGEKAFEVFASCHCGGYDHFLTKSKEEAEKAAKNGIGCYYCGYPMPADVREIANK